MDWETYQFELNAQAWKGKIEGVKLVATWIKSGKELQYFLDPMLKNELLQEWIIISEAVGRSENASNKT